MVLKKKEDHVSDWPLGIQNLRHYDKYVEDFSKNLQQIGADYIDKLNAEFRRTRIVRYVVEQQDRRRIPLKYFNNEIADHLKHYKQAGHKDFGIIKFNLDKKVLAIYDVDDKSDELVICNTSSWTANEFKQYIDKKVYQHNSLYTPPYAPPTPRL